MSISESKSESEGEERIISSVPHGTINSLDEWNRYLRERRRPKACAERERIRRELPRSSPNDELTQVIGDALIVDLEKDIFRELPQSEIDSYEKRRDRFCLTVSEWIANGEFSKIRQLSERVKKRKYPPNYQRSMSDLAKLKALEIVNTYLAEEKKLITQERLLRMLRERKEVFGKFCVEVNHRMLQEIGLNGLPRGKPGTKPGQ